MAAGRVEKSHRVVELPEREAMIVPCREHAELMGRSIQRGAVVAQEHGRLAAHQPDGRFSACARSLEEDELHPLQLRRRLGKLPLDDRPHRGVAEVLFAVSGGHQIPYSPVRRNGGRVNLRGHFLPAKLRQLDIFVRCGGIAEARVVRRRRWPARKRPARPPFHLAGPTGPG